MGGRWAALLSGEPDDALREGQQTWHICPHLFPLHQSTVSSISLAFLLVLFPAVSLVPRTGTQAALSECLWNRRIDRERGPVRRVHLEVATWLMAAGGPSDMVPLLSVSPHPTRFTLSHCVNPSLALKV